uniref:(northern house mosquito) hypothetical protein n=1 Tax=Culex pipiens TaxID=7175 RepID=A0A8D8F4V2_CULPI
MQKSSTLGALRNTLNVPAAMGKWNRCVTKASTFTLHQKKEENNQIFIKLSLFTVAVLESLDDLLDRVPHDQLVIGPIIYHVQLLRSCYRIARINIHIFLQIFRVVVQRFVPHARPVVAMVV